MLETITGKARLPVLIEGNYVAWSSLLRAHLIGVDLWEVVGPEEDELVPRGPKAVAAKKKKQQQAFAKILETISEPQLAYVLETENPHTAWELLEEAHRSTSVNSILSLRRCFFRMTKTESELIMTWISHVRTAALELSRTQYPTIELDVVMVITDRLPDEYTHVISALDALPITKIKIRDVMSRISSAEAQIQRAQEKASEATVALVASDRRRAALTCFTCGGCGHYADNCPTPRSAPTGPPQGCGASQRANFAAEEPEVVRASLAYVEPEDEYAVHLF